MRVLVCGSRSWQDVFQVEDRLHRLVTECAILGEPLTVIDGDARGADRIAGHWASRCSARYAEGTTVRVNRLAFPADWATHGRSAGPIRNQRMLAEGRPDLVLAFVDKPLAESKGTADMVRRAERSGVTVEVHHGSGVWSQGEVVDL